MSYFSEDSAACGIGISANMDDQENHQIVEDSLKKLASLEYRSGTNPATGENDGAGIRFYGLPTDFFQIKINNGEFKGEKRKLESGKYGVGSYFIAKDKTLEEGRKLILEKASQQGLKVTGWRSLDENNSTDKNAITDAAYKKKPHLLQAILIEKNPNENQLEQKLQKASQEIINECDKLKKEGEEDLVTIVSQSSESIVYKGMIPASKIGSFYKDLQDKNFTASAVQMHSRFATNTNPMWRNAQPTAFYIAHNGELNSAGSNATQMQQRGQGGAKPDDKLSDSTLFDRDIGNLLVQGYTMAEALTMLMPPTISDSYDRETQDMLSYLALQRTGYNGPAYMVAGHKGQYFAKLDSVGLRPSRFFITKNKNTGLQQFHAFSDQDSPIHPEDEIINSGSLNPGGIIMLDGAKLVREPEILESLRSKILKNNKAKSFAELLSNHTINLDSKSQSQAVKASLPPKAIAKAPPVANAPLPANANNKSNLHEQMSLSYWDRELDDALRYLTLNGKEQTGAMGADTPQLERGHISQYFHQLFAQVSSPPVDSIKERDSFSLKTYLGANLSSNLKQKQLVIDSPVLKSDGLDKIKAKSKQVAVKEISILFNLPSNKEDTTIALKAAIANICTKAELAAKKGGVIVLTDKDIAKDKMAIPDVIAVRAVRRHLEQKGLINNVSIIADSMQIADTHQASLLLGMGANAVYPRAAYARIEHYVKTDPQFEGKERQEHLDKYQKAMEFGLLKNMGKVGITDINNYINGRLFVALGLDFDDKSENSIGQIFEGVHHKLTGHKIDRFAEFALERNAKASKSPNLPLLGHFRPEHDGERHGFGNHMVRSFVKWMNEEKSRDVFYNLSKADKKFNASDAKLDMANGFIRPDILDENTKAEYKPEAFKDFQTSEFFKQYAKEVNEYQAQYPTTIYDRFKLKKSDKKAANISVQSQAEIRKTLFAGSISQGAITTGDLRIPGNIKAHETITRGINAIGGNSSAGEGGENAKDLEIRGYTARSKQVASGRFGVSAAQISNADEVEIKVAQGAKPGEGGQLPGAKLSIRLASQRGAIPGVELISPPPHHDIYSIEDLEQLIFDIKSVNPKANVAVKLVSSHGIGTIATGVAKAGADVINVASSSGGTGAAMQTSIQNAGLPGEIGLSEVDNALRASGLRDKVKIKSSGGFKTPADVVKSAIFGADLFEFGTIGMMTVGCVMQRTCYTSCEPGVAMEGEKFKGRSVDTMRFFMNIASGVQDLLKEMGIKDLSELKGRFDLLDAANKKSAEEIKYFGIDKLLSREANLPTPSKVIEDAKKVVRTKDDEVIKEYRRNTSHPVAYAVKEPLNASDRAFGAKIAGELHTITRKNKFKKNQTPLTVKTKGSAGQSFGFALAKGIHLKHEGFVQDGAGKSMSGGILSVSHKENGDPSPTVAGNALFYGASGGEGYINGIVGHRFGVLLKGANVVCEGAGQYACEYMTSGTALILGETGRGLGNGASAGVIITYNGDSKLASKDLGLLQGGQTKAYENVIKTLLQNHINHTGSTKAKNILKNFNKEISNFNIYIPEKLKKIDSLGKLKSVYENYHFRATPISIGMKVWLNVQTLKVIESISTKIDAATKELNNLSGFANIAILGNEAEGSYRGKLIEINRYKEALTNFSKDLKNKDYEPFIEKETIKSADRIISAQIKKIDKSFGEKGKKLLAEIKKEEEKSSDNKEKSWAQKTTSPNSNILRQPAMNASERVIGARFVEEDEPKSLTQRIGGHLDYDFHTVVDAIKEYAKQIENDASNCSGCKAQSCAGVGSGTGCPMEKPINAINGQMKKLAGSLKEGQQGLNSKQWHILREAFELQSQRTPFFAFTGAACPAPCESSCTETISGKNPVPIRNIEWNLYQVGKAMGWLESPATEIPKGDINKLFTGGKAAYDIYKTMLRENYTPAFYRDANKKARETVIVIGSGPAGMQIAYRALRDGKKVEMYEKSDKAGGLLIDGIPHHKYDKSHVKYAFDQLKKMGGDNFKLHLNSEVAYSKDKQEFSLVNGKKIFATSDTNKKIVLCTGAGKPRELAEQNQSNMPIYQALDFIKAKNDIASNYQDEKAKGVSDAALDKKVKGWVKEKLGEMNPQGKKVLILGGGDTAQDAIRWTSRYFGGKDGGELFHMVRGPEPSEKHLYPEMANAKTVENTKRDEEMKFIGSNDSQHLTDVVAVKKQPNGKVDVTIRHNIYALPDKIKNSPQLLKEFNSLSREQKKQYLKPDESYGKEGLKTYQGFDMVITALGFEGASKDKFVQDTKHWPNVYIAGDAHHDKPEIIVGAQASAENTYSLMNGGGIVFAGTGYHEGCNSCGTCPASGSCRDEIKDPVANDNDKTTSPLQRAVNVLTGGLSIVK